MSGFDWNGNGRRDIFDSFIEYEIINEVAEEENLDGSLNDRPEPDDIYFAGKQVYDATKDSDSEVIFKSSFAIAMCIGSVILGAEIGGLLGGILLIAGPLMAVGLISNVKE